MKLINLSDFTKPYAIHHVMGVEGGEKFTNYKEDRGGKTRFGVIEKTFLEPEYEAIRKKHGINRIEDITYACAWDIYEAGWWNRLRLDDIRNIHPLIAERLFDIGINSGRGTAAMYLQRILNLFNDNQKLYPDIAVDGGIGNKTIETLKKLIDIRRADSNVIKNIVLQLYVLQSAQWFNQAEKDKSQEKFSWGWSNRAVNSIDDFYKLL